jgi:hypothetical protein
MPLRAPAIIAEVKRLVELFLNLSDALAGSEFYFEILAFLPLEMAAFHPR